MCDIFISEISTLNFDLTFTSILPEEKKVQKRRNKMSAVKKPSALEESPVLNALLTEDVFKGKSKNTGIDFGSYGLCEEHSESKVP